MGRIGADAGGAGGDVAALPLLFPGDIVGIFVYGASGVVALHGFDTRRAALGGAGTGRSLRTVPRLGSGMVRAYADLLGRGIWADTDAPGSFQRVDAAGFLRPALCLDALLDEAREKGRYAA